MRTVEVDAEGRIARSEGGATWLDFDSATDAEQIAWAREGAAAIEPWSYSGGGYVNYMQADEPIERIRSTFGA
jgi:hypothetical protein